MAHESELPESQIRQQLWQRWTQRRDARAFRAVVAHLQPFAYDFARRATGHDADAADLAQEALVELSGTDPAKPAAVGLKAFLGRHIQLGAKMLRRASLTRARHERAAAEARDTAIAPHTAHREETEQALALLDPDQRRAVELRFLHGLSYREVGHVLAITELNARVRVHRALERLRERLGTRAEASLAALPLFLAPARFATHTVRTAIAVGGVLAVASTLKKLLVVLALVGLVGTGAFAWRTAGERTSATRSDRPLAPRTAEHERGEQGRGETDGDDSETATTTSRRNPGASQGPPPDSTTADRVVVAGRVLLSDGSALAGRTVGLWGYEGTTATTDAEGRFELAGVRPGERTLYIAERGLDVGLGLLEVAARGRTAVTVALEAGFDLQGRVTSAGLAVAGAALTVRRGDPAPATPQGEFAFVTADAEGRFRVPFLPAGDYTITASAKGFEAAATAVRVNADSGPAAVELKRARRLIVRFTNLPHEWRGASVVLSWNRLDGPTVKPNMSGDLDGANTLTFDAPPAGRYLCETIAGADLELPRMRRTFVLGADPVQTIVFRLPDGSRVTGTLRDAAGREVAGARLRVEGADLSTTTDSAGRFAFVRVPAGPQVFVLERGPLDLQLATHEIRARGTAAIDLRFPGTVAIRGRLEAGGPNWAKLVELYRPDPDPAATDTTAEGERIAVCRIERDGRFELPHVAPGEYVLMASAHEAPPVRRRLTVRERDIDVGTLRVAPWIRVPVRLTAAPGIELAGRHTASWSGGTCEVQLDRAGSGVLWGLPLGTHVVHLSIEGARPVSITVHVAWGRNEAVRGVLSKR